MTGSLAASARPPRHTVIIGGGIIGASTLYYSSRHPARSPDSRITLLEASKELAPGASGKSGGFLALDWHGGATASLAELSYELHRQLAEEGDGAKRWGYRDVETWQVTIDTAKKRGKGLKKMDWVDGQIVSDRRQMGGPGTTAQVTPKPLVEYLAEAAQREPGVDVRLGAKVTALGQQGRDGPINSVTFTSPGGEEETIECDRVVVAAGPWTGQLLKRTLATSGPLNNSNIIRKARTISGNRAHSIVVRGTRPTTEHCLFTEMRYGAGGALAGEPEVYARADGTVYVCGGGDEEPLPDSADEVGFSKEKTERLIEQIRVISPDVLGEGATIEKQQAVSRFASRPTDPSTALTHLPSHSATYQGAA